MENLTCEMRQCFLASQVYCPMAAGERDGDACAKCPHCRGIAAENGRIFVKCDWSPRASEEADQRLLLAA